MTAVSIPSGVGTPNPGLPPGRHGGGPSTRTVVRTWLVAGIAVVGFGVLALVVAAYLGATFGVQTVLLAVVAALIPLGIVVPTFMWLDRFEAEPTRYLIGAFLWGALVAAVLAAVTNTSIMAVLKEVTQGENADVLPTTAVLVAPVVEESLKGVFVLIVWWFMRREFDGVVDGIVYAGITAAGFAFTENIQYLATAYTDGGRELLTATFVGRCLMSPFAHPMFTVATGIGVGVASASSRWFVRLLAPFLGWVVAVMVHGLWNLAAVSGGQGLFAVYLSVEVPVFLAFVAMVIWTRNYEGRLIGRFLTPYVTAGWLSGAEVAMLSSMPRRREALRWARANGGRAGLAAMRRYQDAASEVAMLRRRMTHTRVDEQALADERMLLSELSNGRRAFIGTAGG